MDTHQALATVFESLDEDTIEYCVSLLNEDQTHLSSIDALIDAIGDFTGLDGNELREKCGELLQIISPSIKASAKRDLSSPQLLDGPVTVDKLIDNTAFEDKYMGLEALKANTNDTLESGTLKDQIKMRNQEQ